MPIGTVKFVDPNKGNGVIAPEDGGNDSFVHISAVERSDLQTLTKDQRASYELETDCRGKISAVNLASAWGVPKEELLVLDGVIDELYPDGRCGVLLENDHRIIAYTAGKMRKYRIKSIVGDRVRVEMTPYDLTKAASCFVKRSVVRLEVTEIGGTSSEARLSRNSSNMQALVTSTWTSSHWGDGDRIVICMIGW